MITFTCPYCGKERTGVRRRCYECTKAHQTPESIERTRKANLGRKATEESRRKNSEWHKNHTSHYFNLAEFMRGKHSHNWQPPGTERRNNGHTKVKGEDGRWYYRARLLWVAAYGFIPEGMLLHHINGDPYDDRLENLRLVTRAEHAALHAEPGEMRHRGKRGLQSRGYNV